MTLSLPDTAGPAQPPTGDGFLAVTLVTMAAEVLLFILWAAAVAPGFDF